MIFWQLINSSIKTIRLNDWVIHILIFIFCGGIYAFSFTKIPTGYWHTFAYLIILQFFLYPFTYTLNDYCDYESDKIKWQKKDKRPKRISLSIPIIFLLLTFIFNFFNFNKTVFLLVLFIVIISYAYSATPIKLKTKGIYGVLSASLGQRVPFFLALTLQYEINTVPLVFLTTYIVITGFLFILNHQLEDYVFDELNRFNTFVKSTGKVFSSKLIQILYVTIITLACILLGYHIVLKKFPLLFIITFCLLSITTVILFKNRYSISNLLNYSQNLDSIFLYLENMQKKPIRIYGAGLAGMIAAINLAKWGYNIEIHTASNKLGGINFKTAGIHLTRSDPARLSKYIGVDITPAFSPVSKETTYIFNKKYCISAGKIWSCLRGNIDGSLDKILYKIACNHGIAFYFDKPLSRITHRSDVYQIYCTGFSQNTYSQLNIPCRKIFGYQAQNEYNGKSRLISYRNNEFGKDFGYVASTNNFCYALLFSRDGLHEDCIQFFAKTIEKTEGLIFEKWEKFYGYIPEKCGLIHNSYLLAGTLSGMIDPFYLSGISGALLSGKLSAYAVINATLAVTEFDWACKNWNIKYKLWTIAQKYAHSHTAYKMIILLNRFIKPVGSL